MPLFSVTAHPKCPIIRTNVSMDKDVFVHGQGSGRMSHKYRKIDQKDQTKAQTLQFEWLLRVSPLAWCQPSLMLQLYLGCPRRLDRFVSSRQKI